MRKIYSLIALMLVLPFAAAQAKKNPFIDSTKKEEQAPPVSGKKTNPFTNPSTKPDTKPDAKPSDVAGEFAQDVQESQNPVVVPFTKLPSGHFLVKVKINGKGPYNLIFDTGAPMMLLNNRIAKASGIKGGGMSLFGSFNPEQLKTLEVGSAVAGKVPAIVLDHPTVSAISEAFEAEYGKIEGIVGFPFFARFATTVDYQKGELRLTPNGYKPGDFINDLQSRLVSMSQQKPEAAVIAPAAVWGFNFKKDHSEQADGVNITTIVAGSPVEKAGLKVGDRLLTIDGRWTDSGADLFRAVAFVKPGSTVDVEVKRDGKFMTLKVTPLKGQ